MALDKKIKVVLIGGTERALITFKQIANRKDICISLVIIMKGYEDEHQYAAQLSKIVESQSIPYYLIDKIDSNIITQCKGIAPDLYLGIGVWRSKLPSEFLAAAHFGYLALHGTGLPEYRGWAGINWQIINGESELRMHGFQLGDGVDNGPLISRSDGSILEYKIDLQNEKHLSDILEEYNDFHIQACHEIIDLVLSNSIGFIEQDDKNASYSCHRGPDDGEVDWKKDTLSVFNFIRAQSKPYKGAYTYYKGKKITIWCARPRYDYKKYKGRIAGKVVTREMETGNVVILTRDGGIEIITAQEHGGAPHPPVKIFDSVREKCKSRCEAYLDSIGW
jgi:methionyl-tRNA formyltransferase